MALQPEEIGLRIRMAREQKGLYQSDLGDKMGLDQRSISLLERGQRRLTVTELYELAEILEQTIYYFLADHINDLDGSALDMMLADQIAALSTNANKMIALDILRGLNLLIAQNKD